MTGYTPPGTITQPPEQFKRWMADNSDHLAGAAKRGTSPYFIANNAKYTDPNWKPGTTAKAPDAPSSAHKRTAEAAEKIQRRWSTRQMNNLWKALGDQHLPKEASPTLARLNELLQQGKFSEFSKSAQPLISAANRHTSRTMAEAVRIQKA